MTYQPISSDTSIVPSDNTHLRTQDSSLLKDLNEPQRQAIEQTEGPLLVLAGAGTGKTRVLTTRIAQLILQKKAYPGQILSVTFTNKAAQEMQHRIESLLNIPVKGWWLGTFHSICVRILRRHAEMVHRTSDFTILDMDDQLRLIKQLLKAEGIDDKRTPPRLIMHYISRWKDKAWLPAKVPASELVDDKRIILKIYQDYQMRLQTLNAVDFGDLILLVLEIFSSHPDILQQYQQQFRYIMVDEYQDTNVAQYLWLRLLALGSNNICCVGDDDQSIYGWRGAEVTNILRFEKDFANAKTIRLEENYRSTPHILGAASGLIAKNSTRLGKTLWTQQDQGDKVIVKSVWDGEEEARYVGDEIESCQRQGYKLSQNSILVRAAYQTREFEDRLITLGVPYKIVGGARFYDRAEIRDALAYLRVIHQPKDSLAFERIVNVPRRGLGNVAMQTLHQYSRFQNVSLFESAVTLIETDEIKNAAKRGLQAVLQDFGRWQQQKATLTPAELAQVVLDESGYTNMLQQDKSIEAPGRLENLKEFINALKEYESLDTFLEHVSLVIDNAKAAHSAQDMVNIMTLHSAKGLEFDVVYLVGWEEGLFPNQRSLDEGNLEEERRLAYVGITRARHKAYICYAYNRCTHGTWQVGVPSRFIEDLPPQHIEVFDQRQVGKHSFGRRMTHPSFTQQPHPEKYSFNREFNFGERVFHIKFGYGKIRDIQGDKLTIDFDVSGMKHVMKQFIKKGVEI